MPQRSSWRRGGGWPDGFAGMRDRAVDAAAYEAWYHTPRGRWIGDVEFRLIRRMLLPSPGESLLDVGCGTGYFTRRFALEEGVRTVGLDPNPLWTQFAKAHAVADEFYQVGRAETLPFADHSFDRTVSVTALCFVEDQRRAVREILRVTRKRFAIGLLNRHSILYRQKGIGGGAGAYRGAHWHTGGEIRALFAGLAVTDLSIRSVVFMPGGGPIGRAIEFVAPNRLPFGAFIVVAGDSRQPGA